MHHGIELQFAGERHRIPLSDLTDGRAIVVYGQTEVVKDLIRLRLESGRALHFDATNVSVHDLETERPLIRYRHEGQDHELECDVIAGCDGFHGICRPSIPAGVLSEFSREYEFGWLGILAAVAPSNDELVYAHHERGFALLSLRSPELSRLYVQCRPDEDLAEWPDDRIWDELQTRLGLEGWTLHEGPILEKGVTGMRSYVCEPMRLRAPLPRRRRRPHRPSDRREGAQPRPPRRAVLAEALVDWFASGTTAGLDSYSDECLRRIWRAEHFSWWMTQMLHRPENQDAFDLKLQLSQLRYVTTSRAATTALAENYVGLVEV